MMEEQKQYCNYDDVVETLINTFGHILNRDCVSAIVQSYSGNIEQSANAIINITMDGNLNINNETENLENTSREDITVNSSNTNKQTTSLFNTTQPSNQQESKQANTSHTASPSNSRLSYAGASHSSAQTMPQQPKPPTKTPNISQDIKTIQLKRILEYNNNGERILIIMRGAPGSGKSYLAKKIIDLINSEQSRLDYRNHILSTDDFFMRNGVYFHDKSRLSEAHEYNQERARKCMMQGLSPVIIDNTNIELWEMQPYVFHGVNNGYHIEVVEPHTPWAKKANQLHRKNVHNVPLHIIHRMLDNFVSGISGSFLIKHFRYQYPRNMQPPVSRKLPPFLKKSTSFENSKTNNMIPLTHVSNENAIKSEISVENSKHMENFEKHLSDKNAEQLAHEISQEHPICEVNNLTSKESSKKIEERTFQNVVSPNKTETGVIIGNIDKTKFIEIKNRLETMDIVEKEWENGDDWEDNSQTKEKKNKSVDCLESRPQRNKLPRSKKVENLLPQVEDCQDWSKISMFLPSWGESSCLKKEENNSLLEETPVIEMTSSSTSVDIGDTEISNLKNPLKIITATARNINENYIVSKPHKIPVKWMLDKSTTTNNTQILASISRCENSESHFIAFRKMFPNVARADLRDIFETCVGDVNWAVSIVLDGVNNQQFGTIDPNHVSDTEEELQNVDNCKCLSAYDVIPDVNESSSETAESDDMTDNLLSPIISTKKVKKEIVSETSIQLKRQIEQNIVIPDNHYSNHCLKIRKLRRGENLEEGNKENENASENTEQQFSDANIPSTSQHGANDFNVASTSTSENLNTGTTDEEQTNNTNDVEQTVNINLGMDLVKQLDQIFGRGESDYPTSVEPRINIPMSVLREINALWIESITYQLEEDRKKTELMIKQDEEFARQIAAKEEELASEGKEPEIPDFDDLMSMDLALFLCDFDGNAEGWRNKQPKDLAAKMSREKLFNLFPEISQDILSELLVAHNNDFVATVEILLTSTGRSQIAEEKNGINKFIMRKEMEKKEQILKEERQNMSEIEWPLLPSFDNVDMETVQRYRDQADKHLKSRQINSQKANDYFRRGMTQVATFYSDFATFHLKKYEQANSLAAVSLMQLHASKKDNDTIDLHFLRVREAREALDLFLDMHIQNLIKNQDKNGSRCQTLFFITGRGLHSNGGPRIKPAIKKRLQERGLSFCERNPGLLSAKVCADTKLSHQIA